MLFESVLVLLTLQLGAVQIAIDTDGSSATVDARYELDASSMVLAFNLIRFPGQSVQFVDVDRSDMVSSVTLDGLYRLTFNPSDVPIVIKYEISGNLSRIPIAVPDAATEPGVRSVRINLRGLSAYASLGDGFPRFELRSGDTAVAELDNVPGFVRLPPDTGQWSVNKISELVVILLIVLASSAWLLRRRRREPSHDHSGDRR